MKRLNNILLPIFFIFYLNISTFAQETSLVTTIKTSEEDLLISAKHIEVFEDPTNKLTLDQILENESLKFQNLSDEHYVIQDTVKTYWVRVKFRGEALENGHWLFELLDSHVGKVEAYQQINDGDVELLDKGGYDYSFNERDYSHKNLIFPIPPVQEGDVFTLYLKYKTRIKNIFLFKMRKDKALIQYASGEYILLGLFYGMLLLLAIYNIMLFTTLRDAFHIYLALFIFSCMLVGLAEDNLGFQYLWADTPSMNYIIMHFVPVAFMLSIVIFTSSFLRIRKEKPLLYKSIWATVLLNIIYISIVGGNDYFLWKAPTFLLPFLIILVYMIQQIRKERLRTWYFIGGYFVLFLGVVLTVLRSHGLYLGDSVFWVYAFNISLLMNVLLMTLGLVQSFKVLKEDKEQAQQKIIFNLKEREKIIEAKVEERTKEVEEQKQMVTLKNQELEVVNQMLTEHRIQIENMNDHLQQENEKLHEDVEKLATARVLMKEVSFDEFSEMFPDDESCYKYLADIKWRNGYSCKKCQNTTYSSGQGKEARRCKKCSYNESATNGTLFHRLHFPIRNAFHMLFIVFANKGDVTSSRLAEILNMRQNTCWKFSKKIKEAMEKKRKELGSDDKLKNKGWDALIMIEK